MDYDILISGAGPSGLSAAIYAARKGMKVLVLEKYKETGVFPRGETMRPDPILTDLLGKGFMASLSLNRTAKRRYWSPGTLKNFELEREAESYIFHWKDLTEGLREAAEKAGAEIRFNSEVAASVITDGRCTGLMLADGTQVSGKTVIAADGHRSKLTAAVDHNRLNCPITKRLCQGITSDYDGMEFFFIAPGSVEPDFPAAFAFIFPRGNNEAEVGFGIIAGALSKKQRERMPSDDRMIPFLQKLFDEYPVFSERVGSATWNFQGITRIPMGGLHMEGMEVPGIILSGDTIGMVEASGGCGIIPSMKNGQFIIDFIEKHQPVDWNKSLMLQYNKDFKESDIRRHIAGKYKKIFPLMRLGFGRAYKVKTYARIWGLVDRLYSRV